MRGPQPEAERRGQRGQEHVVGGEVRDPVGEVVEREPARLVVHHHLGQAGGARRRVEEPELVGADRPFRDRHPIRRRRFAEQRARAGAFDEVRDLPFAGAGADPDRDDARLLAREHRRVHARAVGELQRDAVAGREAAASVARHQRRALVVLAPRHRLARRGLDERDAVGTCPERCGRRPPRSCVTLTPVSGNR